MSRANRKGGGAQGFGLGWYERESKIAEREWDRSSGGGWVTDLVVKVVLVDFFFFFLGIETLERPREKEVRREEEREGLKR